MKEHFCLFQNNIPVGTVVIPKPDLTSIPRCECDPNSEAPCSSDTDCLNRMLMYECHPSVCQCGEKCRNQRFQRREYPDCTPFKTEGRGWGLRTNVAIKKVLVTTNCVCYQWVLGHTRRSLSNISSLALICYKCMYGLIKYLIFTRHLNVMFTGTICARVRWRAYR